VNTCRRAEHDESVGVIVFRGAGDKAFSSGMDLKERAQTPVPPIERRQTKTAPEANTTTKAAAALTKPTIAMINGPAVGSGMDMALHCDIRIGCERTRFIGYHNAGQIIENGGSYYLPKMVGLGRALEFAYTGELNAERAYQWGVLNHLVPSEKLEETTRELCARMMGIPPMVQWISKRIMRAALDSSLETTMVMTSNAGGILQSSEDAKEARRAFMEKRKGQFRGL